MCGFSIVSLGLSLASGFMGYQQQVAQAEQQSAMIRQQQAANEQTKLNVLASQRYQQQGLDERRLQERSRVVESIRDSQINTLSQLSTLQTAAAESGVSGVNVSALEADLSARGAYDTTIMNRNLRGTLNQLDREESGVNARTMNQINSLNVSGTVPNVSPLSSILSTAQNAFAVQDDNTGGSYLGNRLFGADI